MKRSEILPLWAKKYCALQSLWNFTQPSTYYTMPIFRPFSDRFQSINLRENGLKTVWMFQTVFRSSVIVQSTFTQWVKRTFAINLFVTYTIGLHCNFRNVPLRCSASLPGGSLPGGPQGLKAAWFRWVSAVFQDRWLLVIHGSCSQPHFEIVKSKLTVIWQAWMNDNNYMRRILLTWEGRRKEENNYHMEPKK